MSNCPWITVVHREEGTTIVEHEQAYDSICLPRNRLSHQTPVFVALIGKNAKLCALRKIFAASNEIVPAEPHGQIRLWSDPRTRRSNSPIIYMDCELHNHSSTRLRASYNVKPGLHRKLVSMQPWLGPPSHQQQRSLGFNLYAKVLLPFVSVCCVFAEDMGSLRGVAEMLAEQAICRSGSELPRSSLSRALILLASHPTFDEGQALHKLLNLTVAEMRNRRNYGAEEDPRKELFACYFDVRVIGLPSDCKENPLERELHSKITDAQAARAFDRTLFHFGHFQAFTTAALEHFAAGTHEHFHFLRASRSQIPVSCELSNHLEEFLGKMPVTASQSRFGVPVIASALLLDSCPPGMHHFSSVDVFQEFYLQHCSTAIHKITNCEETITKFLTDIQEEYRFLHTGLISNPRRTSASQIHRQNLHALQHHLAKMKSNKTCFSCLMRMPEKVLTCGHAICDICIKIFGRRSISTKYTFDLPKCLLCGSSPDSPTFQLMGPTYGFRVLSLDGGGVRGVMPLVFLQFIEGQLKEFECPLQDYFDLVCGTSSGGLIVLGLFIMRWTPSECLKTFEDLAAKIFKRRRNGSIIFSRLQELVMSWLADCRYDSTIVEEALHTAFGSLRMFNPVSTDTKVAVTTTTAREVLPCIFSNYNGGQRPKEAGCNLVRAADPDHDISVSDAGRCTSAAPWFFKPKFIKHLGTFQDGGLKHNNPLNVALWESKYIWPERGEPDLVLSLGTGTCEPASGTTITSPFSPVRDRFPFRLFTGYMSDLDGEKVWREYHNTLGSESKKRSHRLNPHMRSDVNIDDVSSISSLKAKATEYINSFSTANSILDSFYSSAFYFEFESIPEEKDGYFICNGHIFCRLNLNQAGRAHLYRLLSETSAYFLIDGRPTFCMEGAPKCLPPFKRRVQFSIQSMETVVHIVIKGLTSEARLISGLPRTARELVGAQMLNAPFGRPDHVWPEKMLPQLPSKRRRPKSL